MAELESLIGPCPFIPDDVTVVQFMLDSYHPLRPIRPVDTPWLIDDTTGRGIGLEEIRTRVWGLANALHVRFGIREDDVVLIYSPNHMDYLLMVWAVHRLGATMSGANPSYTTDELVYQIEETKCTLVITHPASLKTAHDASRKAKVPGDRIVLFNIQDADHGKHITVDELVAQGLNTPPSFVERKLNPGEGKTKIAFLSFSSGTTGRAKAVAIPHIAPIANVIQCAAHNKVNQNYTRWEDQRFRPGDTCCGILPLYHIYGLVYNTHYIFFCGMSVVLAPKFSFTDFLKSIAKYKITHLMLVPPQIVLLCKHPAVKEYDFSHVRFATIGAAPISRELMEMLIKVFPNADIGQSYGSTETCTILTTFPIDIKRDLSGSGGQFIPGVTARVVDTNGKLVDFDEPGELVVKCPSMALGYANNAEATKETFVDGWFRTGDEVKITRKGEIFVLDRLKEMIKVKGHQVAPAELEGCLLEHPDVADTCVVSILDEYAGELPLAYVALNPDAARRAEAGPTEADAIKASIQKHVADNKIAYKHLAAGVEFIDVVPKNPSGKLLRRVLRDRARKERAVVKAKL
ncbi:phenylacetyl-CoA ligase [Coniophora puteana RWD-64-598 SS2]|uniref:Phenylacetyl-CoA ligase n=1 Tax=Coniophora puteana (strain RWD-64-598) TaxID=741705 RepID=A0A5M3MQI3_CONPW|nr:phenylacetyl-CoA ligase [Coniophora puteana RWD-64-598 SS2]EIW81327.1 phenylacetyl-CoA ligase [Coniophora puteana RWD-64-598 SS2]